MSTNKSAKLSKKLGVYLEDAVTVFELLKMPTNKSAKLFDKLGVHLEDAVDVFELLKTELDTTSSSSKATNTDMFEELNGQKADLKAIELQLQADLAEFKVSERELKAAKAKLEEDMQQLEDEKTQFRVAQILLKAAQSQLEDAKRNLESAQTQLEEAMGELETARKHLEAAKTQTDITNTRLAAAKQSLDAAKMRFEGATKQLNDAKSKFDDATTQLEAATSANATAGVGMSMILEEEKSRNPIVFFDMTIRGESAGRITFELFADIIPDHVEFFRAFCTGEKGVNQKGIPLHYKGMSIAYFHTNYILGGNLGTMTLDEAQSIYGDLKPVGKEFIKESLTFGDLFMFSEPDRRKNYSFGIFISTNQNPAEFTFASNVVIGKVIQGIEVLHAIKIAFSNQRSRGLSMNELVIANSGQLP